MPSVMLCKSDNNNNKDIRLKELQNENKELRDENHKLTRDVRDFYRDATNLAKQLISS
jgi:hypothetical protein